MTVRGNYIGTNASLRLNATSGTDSLPADQLIIDGGLATGNTGIQVANIGGTGGGTTADGILLVQTLNGASTGNNAFVLTRPVQVGAYDCRLFRGARRAAARTTGTCGPPLFPWLASW